MDAPQVSHSKTPSVGLGYTLHVACTMLNKINSYLVLPRSPGCYSVLTRIGNGHASFGIIPLPKTV